MAIQRSYTAPEFGGRDTREITRQQLVGASPVRGPIVGGDDTWRDRMLADFAGKGAQIMEKAADLEFQREYLEGAAAVGIVESEDALEGNPLTRDWRVAGYRDTQGKLALADSEAQFLADLPKLREGSPEEMHAYLSKRREKIQPLLASMSREARAAAGGQMLTQDRTAIRKYTTENTKYVLERKAQAIHQQWDVSTRHLQMLETQVNAGVGSAEDYQEQVRSSAVTMVQSVWADPSLPGDVKRQLTMEMLQRSLSSDSVGLYEYVQTNAFPDDNGGTSTLVSRLDGDQQLKLANANREARQRTANVRNLAQATMIADLDSRIDNDAYTGTRDALISTLQPMVVNGALTQEKYTSLVNKFYDKQYKGEINSAIAGMLLRGDVNGIANSGKSMEQAVTATEQMLYKQKATPEQRLQTWLTVGQSGVTEGFKKAGEYLGVAVRQIALSKDGEVLPQHRDTFLSINNALRRAEGPGYNVTRATLLSGLGTEDAVFVEQVLRRVDQNYSVDEAVLDARNARAADAALTPSARAGKAQQSRADVEKEIAGVGPRGLLSTAGLYLKSMFSANAAADLTLRPLSTMSTRDGWFSDSPTAEFYAEATRDELRIAADNVALLRPGASASTIMTAARADLLKRTVDTKNGPLFLPQNVDLQQAFGVAPGNQAAIGKAIDSMLSSTVANSRWQLKFAQGTLLAQEVDNTGVRVGSPKTISGQEINTAIREATGKEQQAANWVFGNGRTMKDGDASVTFDGQSTSGAPATWVYGLRENLVAHEGVRTKVYDDLSGNKDAKGNPITTVGVGVSSTNTFYPKPGPDGTISQADLDTSFRQASDEAAKAGARVARSVGRYNQYGFQLMSELAYQSGPAFMTRGGATGDNYRAFGEALQGTDVKAAQDAFKKTAAWYYSRNPKNPDSLTKRQKSYLSLIENSMR